MTNRGIDDQDYKKQNTVYGAASIFPKLSSS